MLKYACQTGAGIRLYILTVFDDGSGRVSIFGTWLKSPIIGRHVATFSSLFEAVNFVRAGGDDGQFYLTAPKTLRDFRRPNSSALHEARKASLKGDPVAIYLADGSIRLFENGRTLLLKKKVTA